MSIKLLLVGENFKVRSALHHAKTMPEV